LRKDLKGYVGLLEDGREVCVEVDGGRAWVEGTIEIRDAVEGRI